MAFADMLATNGSASTLAGAMHGAGQHAVPDEGVQLPVSNRWGWVLVLEQKLYVLIYLTL
jgi:hypothetical protein